jgi:coenzyme F420 hydrogenase subunit beta
MKNKHMKNVEQVVCWRLCMGCGACITACKENAISFLNVFNRGIRPKVDSTKCKECSECVSVCPGVDISHQPFNRQTIPQLRQAWGPVLEVWEGYATDTEIRFRSSSGGVATALALFCIRKKYISGVLHIQTDSKNPLQNIPVFSKSREALLACTGSRYAPAAPCEKFKWMEEAPFNSVFIGKPCDVVALRKSQAANPTLNEKVSLAISIFCAGTPTIEGTYSLLDTLGVKPEQVEELRYRGFGWPGTTAVKVKGDNGQEYQVSYEQSWGKILSKHIQFRCRICPDSTGEFADISCGDPWCIQPQNDEPGRSLILVRTEIGRETLFGAMREDYVKAQKVSADTLPKSQKALLSRRQNLFGRLFAMRMMHIPTPHYDRFSLFANWHCLSLLGRIRSILGTLRRAIVRRWNRPMKPYRLPGT